MAEQVTFYRINMNFRFSGDKRHFSAETGAKNDLPKPSCKTGTEIDLMQKGLRLRY